MRREGREVKQNVEKNIFTNKKTAQKHSFVSVPPEQAQGCSIYRLLISGCKQFLGR
jgi:hypothetical protein